MKKDRYQQLPIAEKILKLKECYLMGKYQELIIHDEYIYPPIQKDIKEILISQFGISLLDEYIRNYSEEKINRKNKFPLPIIFAFIHHHIKTSKYENLIRIIMQHVDRKAVENYYILIYIIAKIYQKFNQFKKSIFYLENLLKESPFFSQAVYDLCYHYAFKFQREQESCSILERHIGHCQTDEKYIHSLYINICSKLRVRSVKDVLKNLHNKSMNLVAYYNLGIYLRQNQEIEKAYQIFSEIIAKLSKIKTQKNEVFSVKDEKLLFLSKVNLLMILKIHNPIQKNKASEQIDSLSKQITTAIGTNLDYQVLSKISTHKQIDNAPSSQLLKSQKVFRNYFSTRKSKDLSAIKEYKQEKTVQNEQKSIQNKQNHKLTSFNNDFSTLRQYNNKKLKYLLEKQKQINHFFKNLVIRKDGSTDKVQIQYKIKEKPTRTETNDSSIIKAKSLNNNEYQSFQKQFENKRRLHQLKYDDTEIQSMLAQIMTNFENCVAENKHEKKIVTITKNYSQSSKNSISKQSLRISKHTLADNSPKSSQCSRKTEKPEKRALASQITNRVLKSDRMGGNFRIRQASKEPQEIQQQKQQELIPQSKESVILPILNQAGRNDFQKIQLKPPVQENKKETSDKILQNGEKSFVFPMISQKNEIPSQQQEVIKINATQSQKILEDSEESENQKLKELKEQASEKALVSQQNEKKQESKKSIEEKNENYMLQSHTSSMNCEKNQSNLHYSQIQVPQVNESDKTVEQINQNAQIFNVNNQPETTSNPNQIAQLTGEEKLGSQKIIEPQNPIVTTPPPEIEPVKKPEEVTPPAQSKPAYDPFASSFQLTGFGKASLSKFRELKKKKKVSPSESIEKEQQKISKQTSSKKIEEARPQNLDNPFQSELREGQRLEKAGEYEKAYQLYTKLYKNYKKQTQKQIVLIKIGSLFEAQQKFAQAEKTYLKCTKFNNVEAFLKLGALLLKNGRVNSGVENIQKANCLKRNDIAIENKLVYGYSLREETMEKALNLAQMILKKQPQSLETLIITANILEKQGKIKEAIDIMTAIDKFKSAQYIKHYLGILYLQDSNLTEAFNYFKAALNIKADYLPSLIEVATIISEISPKQSISILQKVLQIEPQNRKALARLGKIYESIEKDFESAMSAYQTALQTQQNYESYMKIGDCLAKKQSYIEALINYKQALNLKKTHEAYAKVAFMFHLKQEFLKAIQNYQQALNLLANQKDCNNAKRKEYLTYLGNLSLKVGNYDAGIKFFQEIDDYEDSIQILKLLAEAYFGKKQYSMALEKYEKASEIAKGENLEILENIAICFDKMEEYLASKAIYEKILQKDPENIRCMNNLANILLITGETNESFYLFENMLQKAPKNLEKRLKVVDIYAEVGDWSKVEFHLLHCLKQKENDERVIERMINLYKEKRDIKMANKYEKKLAIMRANRKGQQKAATPS